MPGEILWINGALGVGKTQTICELHYRIPYSRIFDPECIGYGIQKAVGKKFAEDFQDFRSFRISIVEALVHLSQQYSGTILIPMTLYNQQYFHEVFDELNAAGLKVRHIALLAEEHTIQQRLRKRNYGILHRILPQNKLPKSEDFALRKMRDINVSLEELPAELKIRTDTMNLTEVVECIAEHCGYTLMNDNAPWKQSLRKIGYAIKNKRF